MCEKYVLEYIFYMPWFPICSLVIKVVVVELFRPREHVQKFRPSFSRSSFDSLTDHQSTASVGRWDSSIIIITDFTTVRTR